MDGRVQLPVIQYLQKRFDVDFVDSVTEAGPNLILSEAGDNSSVQSILSRVNVSVEHHDSVGIAVVGHHSCTGNPASRDEQVDHIQNAVRLLRQQYKNVEVTGLWVDRTVWDCLGTPARCCTGNESSTSQTIPAITTGRLAAEESRPSGFLSEG